jgi:hypothetical protein
MTTKRSPRPKPTVGPNRAATLSTLTELGLEPESNTLSALALTLADALDAGAGAQVANIARELRHVVRTLAEAHNVDDAAFDGFMASFSTPGS